MKTQITAYAVFSKSKEKIIHLVINMEFVFPHRLGLDPKLLAKILNMSSGRCWSSDTYNPVPGVMEGVPSGNNYQGGFGTQLMAKVSLMTSLYSVSWACNQDLVLHVALVITNVKK